MGRPKKSEGRIEVTQWEHKSQMDPKIILGDAYDPTKAYRFVREDKAEFTKQAHGYEPTGKKFKELVLMQTSKDHYIDRQKEKHARTKALTAAKDDSVRHEVNRQGRQQGRKLVYFED